MDTRDSVIAVLRHRGRARLADFIAQSRVELEEDGDSFMGDYLTVTLTASIAVHDQLKLLKKEERDDILEAFTECNQATIGTRVAATTLRVVLDPSDLIEPQSETDVLIGEIEAQRGLMVDVATGGPRIDSVEDQYTARRTSIAKKLSARGLEDPNPYDSLWDWYQKWSKDLDTYRSRREYLSSLYKPVIERVRVRPGNASPPLFSGPTGWAKVDAGLTHMKRLLETAHTTQHYQSVGLFCRELLITLAQTVYDAERHPTTDGQRASATDAKRMLEAYIVVEAPGTSNEGLRKHARASFDLANDLQHRRTATFREAAFCAEATTSVVNLIAIASGRRDPA